MFKISEKVEPYRKSVGPYHSKHGDPFGLFVMPRKANVLAMIAVDGKLDGWEHVSVSLKNRCPNWEEMCFVKSLFWDDEDTVMQIHPPKSENISLAQYCLHLWRPINQEIPKPPAYAVGLKTNEKTDKEAYEQD